jgi:cytidine deaminase
VSVPRDVLLERAREARLRAHAPYSGFEVGAAVATPGGVHAGCNVENASFGATVCAERVAVFCAVAAGETELLALAVVAPGEEPVPPCGACLQVLAELADDLPVYLGAAGSERVIATSLGELLPMRFRLERGIRR